MAAPQIALAFLELLEKSKLLSSEEVAAAIARHGFKPDQDPRVVAQALVKDRLLTRFQAAQLLKGRDRGFVIDGYKLLEILGAGGMGMVYVALDTQSGRSLRDRHRRTAIGPAASQRQIETQSQFPGFAGGEPQRTEKLIGKEGEVLDPCGFIVQFERIDRLDFESPDPAFLHVPHVLFELRRGDGGSKPPPAPHDATLVRRILKLPLEFFHVSDTAHLGRVGRGERRQQEKQTEAFHLPRIITPRRQ